jgi:hypothetical protein
VEIAEVRPPGAARPVCMPPPPLQEVPGTRRRAQRPRLNPCAPRPCLRPPQELLSLPPEEAAERAERYIDLWGFKNTYAMGKHLAEKAVAALQREFNLPLCIVRPSLVSAVAAEPYAGYVGESARPRAQNPP